ncbi:uncharacterized protein FFB14_11097 [Fusarium fujikuroi]|nr:uncharacterized protein FFB14_11097 [Fusarium fujikuroi]
MSDDTIRPDECDDETSRIYSSNVHSNKVHLQLQPKNAQPSRLRIEAQDMHAEYLDHVSAGCLPPSHDSIIYSWIPPQCGCCRHIHVEECERPYCYSHYSNGWAYTTPRGHRFLPSLRSFTSTIRPSNQVDRSPLSGYSALPHVEHLKTLKHVGKKEPKRISVGKVDRPLGHVSTSSISAVRSTTTEKDIDGTIEQVSSVLNVTRI